MDSASRNCQAAIDAVTESVESIVLNVRTEATQAVAEALVRTASTHGGDPEQILRAFVVELEAMLRRTIEDTAAHAGAPTPELPKLLILDYVERTEGH